MCSSLSTPLSFELRPQGGRGVAVLVLSQSELGSAADFDDALRIDRYATGSLDDARQKNATRLEGLGYPKAKLLKTGTLQPGRLDSAAFALPKGCVRLDILPAAPVRDISVRLWSADDSLIAESDARAAPVLFACSGGGLVRLDTESLARPGEYSVELQSRARTCSDLAGVPARRQPLARAHAGARLDSQRHAGRQNHAPPLDPRAPRDRAALGALRTLRRFHAWRSAWAARAPRSDWSTKRLGKSSRCPAARNATSARICAFDARAGGTIHARAELRVDAGQGEGLSTTHMTTPAR